MAPAPTLRKKSFFFTKYRFNLFCFLKGKIFFFQPIGKSAQKRKKVYKVNALIFTLFPQGPVSRATSKVPSSDSDTPAASVAEPGTFEAPPNPEILDPVFVSTETRVKKWVSILFPMASYVWRLTRAGELIRKI